MRPSAHGSIDAVGAAAALPSDHDALAIAMAADGTACRSALNRLGIANHDIAGGMDPAEAARAAGFGRPLPIQRGLSARPRADRETMREACMQPLVA